MHVIKEYLLVIGLQAYITHFQNLTFYVYFICVLSHFPLLMLRLTTSK